MLNRIEYHIVLCSCKLCMLLSMWKNFTIGLTKYLKKALLKLKVKLKFRMMGLYWFACFNNYEHVTHRDIVVVKVLPHCVRHSYYGWFLLIFRLGMKIISA